MGKNRTKVQTHNTHGTNKTDLATKFCDLEQALEDHCEDDPDCEALAKIADIFIQAYKIQLGLSMYHVKEEETCDD